MILRAWEHLINLNFASSLHLQLMTLPDAALAISVASPISTVLFLVKVLWKTQSFILRASWLPNFSDADAWGTQHVSRASTFHSSFDEALIYFWDIETMRIAEWPTTLFGGLAQLSYGHCLSRMYFQSFFFLILWTSLQNVQENAKLHIEPKRLDCLWTNVLKTDDITHFYHLFR